MWLQQGSHHSVGFLVRITCFSKQHGVWRRKKVLSWYSLQRQKWVGVCRTVMGTDLHSLVKRHHVAYILDYKEYKPVHLGTKHVGPETRTRHLRKCLGFVWQSTKSPPSPSSVTSRIWYAQSEEDHRNHQCP